MRPLDPRLLRRASPARVLLGVDAGIGLVAALLVLAQAVLLAHVAARSFEGASLGDVSTALVLLVVVVCARAFAAWGFELAGRRAAIDVLSTLRLDLAERRLRDRPAALDGVQSGEIGTLAVTGVEALETTFSRYLPQLVLALVVPVAVLALVAAIDLVSAAVMLVTLPLVPVFMWLVGRYTEQRARARWLALRLLATHFLDVVRGLPTLRAYNRGRAQTQRIAEVSDEYRRATMGTLRVAFLSGAVLELAATLGIALVAVTVGVRLVEGDLALGTSLTVLLLAPELYLPLRNLAAQFHAGADGLAVAERLLDLVGDEPRARPGIEPPPSPRDVPVRLERVSFSYPAREGRALDDVSLELLPGETTALVGPSGGGKSTIASLLLRFAEPGAGRVTAGDVDLAACDAASWRARIAWVPQQPTIFRGSVLDNIRLGDVAAGEGRIREAASLAGADAFVSALPRGYDTLVGDGGRPLSPGEQRRIALARAFLRDAAFVILDETTADLDPASAQAIGESIERLREGRTVLLIAHRPELVARADRVVRIEAGRALEAAVEGV